MKRRSGTTLVELVVALALTALMCGIIIGPFIAVERSVRLHAERLANGDALRVPALVLRGELRWLDPAADIDAIGRDSIAVRAFRGAAVVCDVADDAVHVGYRGLRRPNPEKDSVLVVAGDPARSFASPLRTSTTEAASCPDRFGATAYIWTMAGPPEPGTLLLLFERGSYHLTDHALRYRRGGAGRQPLTAERFDDAASRFGAAAADGGPAASPADAVAAVVDIALLRRPGGRRPALPAPLAATRVPFLNRPVGSPVDTSGSIVP